MSIPIKDKVETICLYSVALVTLEGLWRESMMCGDDFQIIS